MLIYIVNLFSIFLYQGLYVFFKKRGRDTMNFFLFLVFIQFVLIQGLRASQIGNDTVAYMTYYERLPSLGIVDILFNNPFPELEIGYVLLMCLSKFLGISSQGFIFVIAVLINVLLFKFIKNESENCFMSLWLFVCLGFFTLSFTMIRQMLAMLLLANSIKYIKERKLIYFILYILLAATIHKTSIFCIFMYPILNAEYILNLFKLNKISLFFKKYKGYLLAVIIVVGRLCMSFLAIIVSKFSNYGVEISRSGANLYLVMIMVLIVSLFIEKIYEIESKKYNFYQIIMLLSILIQGGTASVPMFGRFALYFYFFIIIFIPQMITYLHGKTKNILLVLFWILPLIQYLFISMSQYNLVPYSSIIF